MERDVDGVYEIGVAHPVSPLKALFDGACNLSFAETDLISQLCKNGIALRERIAKLRQNSSPRCLFVEARDSRATCQLLSFLVFLFKFNP